MYSMSQFEAKQKTIERLWKSIRSVLGFQKADGCFVSVLLLNFANLSISAVMKKVLRSFLSCSFHHQLYMLKIAR